jgi:hypothetical protein
MYICTRSAEDSAKHFVQSSNFGDLVLIYRIAIIGITQLIKYDSNFSSQAEQG